MRQDTSEGPPAQAWIGRKNQRWIPIKTQGARLAHPIGCTARPPCAPSSSRTPSSLSRDGSETSAGMCGIPASSTCRSRILPRCLNQALTMDDKPRISA
eukprot:9468666-Pyramimonas_sp.AAC.3